MAAVKEHEWFMFIWNQQKIIIYALLVHSLAYCPEARFLNSKIFWIE